VSVGNNVGMMGYQGCPTIIGLILGLGPRIITYDTVDNVYDCDSRLCTSQP